MIFDEKAEVQLLSITSSLILRLCITLSNMPSADIHKMQVHYASLMNDYGAAVNKKGSYPITIFFNITISQE